MHGKSESSGWKRLGDVAMREVWVYHIKNRKNIEEISDGSPFPQICFHILLKGKGQEDRISHVE